MIGFVCPSDWLRVSDLESGRVHNYGGFIHWKYVERASMAEKGRDSGVATERSEASSYLTQVVNIYQRVHPLISQYHPLHNHYISTI